MAAKLTYSEQLKHPNWQRKRLEMLEVANFECSCCGDKEKTLHVHHRRYIKGRMAWEYEGHELAVLCEDCHKDEHDARELLERILSEADQMTGSAFPTAIGLLSGYFASSLSIGPELEREAIAIDGHSHDLGILAGIACGAGWDKMAKAAEAVRSPSLTPAEQHAMDRWKGE